MNMNMIWWQERQRRWQARTDEVTAAAKAMIERHRLDADPDDFSIGPGWLPLVDEALGRMIVAGWDRQLAQVKSKFCVLVIYVGGESNWRIEAIIHEAQARSTRLCEHCGGPHGLEVPRSGTALCRRCVDAEDALRGVV